MPSNIARYLSHKDMRSHIMKAKRFNKEARIVGIDVGRKYVGLAVSDKAIKLAKPFRTLVGEA